MGKRFLISLLLVLAVVGAMAGGAALIFHESYEDLEALEAQERAAEQSLSALPQITAEDLNSDLEESEAATGETAASGPQISAPQAGEASSQVKNMVQSMTLHEKICQMMFVTPEVLTQYTKVTQSGPVTQEALADYPVGGVIYFADNLVTLEQTTEMLSNIQSYAMELNGRGLFLGVDEEGGTVARVADNLGTTAFDDMRTYGDAGDTAKAYEIGSTLAAELKEIGFNVDFAPVADVLTNENNTVIGDRSFGTDAELVSQMVSQEVQGLTQGGVLCAPKHFPGHGSTDDDTHDGFAASDRTMEELESCDLKPFQAAIDAGAPMIMVGHMTMTAIDSENPASMSSKVVTELLRQQMGYEGIIITDAMNMGAISNSYTSGEAAVNAIAAGCDMVLCVNNLVSAVESVTQAVEDGTLSEAAIDQSVARILSAKLQYGLIAG